MPVHSEDAGSARGSLTASGRQPAWDGRSYGTSLGHRIFIATIRAAGRWPTYLLLAFVVPYYCLVARRARCASREYLDRLLGKAGVFRSFARTYRHFFTFGTILVDRFIYFIGGPDSFDFEANGWVNIEQALARKKGVIFLSAHLGAWEIAASIRRGVDKKKLPVPLNVVMYLPAGEKAPSFVKILEEKGDLKIISVEKESALPLEIIAALERGEIVAFHGDRVLSEARARVPFLGEPADFPTGPWQLAAATGAPVVPVFLVKVGWRRYSFDTLPPLFVTAARKDRARLLESHMLAFSEILESIVRKHPYQWFNFYEFWK